MGQKSTNLFNAGLAAAAKYINASQDEIGEYSSCFLNTCTNYGEVLGSSTTQLFRNLSFALEYPAGSELIISKIDHEANIASWVAMAARQKLILKWWLPKTKENPKLLASDLKELLSEKTVLVTCTHASNILGTIHDIKAIADAVHTIPGAMLCVDAVAYAPHRRIDVKALGVDFYGFSWYKVYLPNTLNVSLLTTPGLRPAHLNALFLPSRSSDRPFPRSPFQPFENARRQARSRRFELRTHGFYSRRLIILRNQPRRDLDRNRKT